MFERLNPKLSNPRWSAPWKNTGLLAATRFVCWTVKSSGFQDSRSSISSNLQILSCRPIMLRSKWLKGSGRVIGNHMPRTGKIGRQITSWRPKDWILNFQIHGDQQSRLTNANNKKQPCESSTPLRCHKHEMGFFVDSHETRNKFTMKKNQMRLASKSA
jgi:hypothetical protein